MKMMQHLRRWGLVFATLCIGVMPTFGDVEPNDNIETAEPMELNTPYSGSLSDGPIIDNIDYYAVQVPEDGTLTVDYTRTADDLRVYVRIYRSTGGIVITSTLFEEEGSVTANCLAADLYYVSVQRYSANGEYTIVATNGAYDVPNDQEPNNSREQAFEVFGEGEDIQGHLGHTGQFSEFFGTDDNDYYLIETDKDGDITASIESTGNLRTYLVIQRVDGPNLAQSTLIDASGSVTATCRQQGTYILRVQRYSGCGSYTVNFEVSELAFANDAEPNNSIGEIQTHVEEFQTVTGHLGHQSETGTNDDDDYYYIISPRDGDVTVTMNLDSAATAYLRIYNKNGSSISTATWGTGELSSTAFCVAQDTIVVHVDRYDGCGSYELSFETTPPTYANDVEPNNTLGEINTAVEEFEEVMGHIGYYDVETGTDQYDYFYILSPRDGDVTVTLNLDSAAWAYLRIFDKNGTSKSTAVWGTGELSTTAFCMAQDTLVVRIDRYSGCGSYQMSFQTTPPTYANDMEPNNTLEEINTAVEELEVVTGHIGYEDVDTGTDHYDYFYILSPRDGDVMVTLNLDSAAWAYLRIFDKNGSSISTAVWGTGELSTTAFCMAQDTLVVRIDLYSGCGSYELSFETTPPTYANDYEPNNSIDQAIPVLNYTTNSGHLGYWLTGNVTDVNDYYSIQVNEVPFDLEAKFELTGTLRAYLRLLNSNGSQIQGTSLLDEGEHTLTYTIQTPGIYYFRVQRYSDCGSYTLGDFCGSPPDVTATVDGPTTLCPGEETTLEATPGLSVYVWYKDGVEFAFTQSVTVDEPGEYHVFAFDGNTCAATSPTVVIEGYPIPPLAITPTGQTVFCEGGDVTLNASSGFDTYLWSTGETESSITVSQSGEYSVEATTADGCSVSSESVAVTVKEVPELTVSADGDLSFCLGGEVTLTASGGFASYLWSNGSTESSITVTESGEFFVTATTTDDCSETSESVVVTAGTDGECAPDCFGIYGGDGIVDDCGECRTGTSDPDYNSTCTDCNGDVNGTAYLDGCGTCVGGNTGLEPCGEDCFGVAGGDGIFDDCGVCRHGESDPDYNSTCVDCNGDVNGTAYFDDCGTCVGGNTGLEPCGEDCFGVAGGDGILDDCGVCRHGESDPDYNSTCVDCNGDVNGTAYFDDCGTCVGGNTGLEPCGEDCFGVAGGDGILDDCGVCRHGESDPDFNSTCVDCNGEVNGTAYFDDCGACVGGNTGLEPCGADCFGIAGGDGILDDCGICRHGESDPDYNSSCEDCAGVPNGPALPGTPCEVDGSFGTYNDWCECIPETGECAFDYFLSSANDAGGTDIFRMHLNDENGTADLELLNSVDEPVSIAYHAVENQLYLISHGQPAYRVMDAGTGDLTPKTSYNYNAHGFTAAAFGPDGILYVGSESKQKVFAYNPQTHSIVDRTPAPVVGGDLAVGNDGEVYMVSRAPHILGIVNFNGPNEFIRYITYNAAGLALTSDGNLLLAIDGRKNVMVGTTDGDDTGIRYNYMYNGQPYFVLHADLASGCPDDVPVATALRAPNTIEAEAAADNRVELASSPNPTSDISNVWFNAAQPETVVLEVFDLNGRNIATLYNGNAEGGLTYRFQFDGSGLPNGIYLYRLTTERGVQIEKFMIAR